MDNIVIAGAGISGVYFAKLLKNEGVKFTLYDPNRMRGHQCAWRSHHSLLKERLDKVGLDISNYILCRVNYCYFNNIKNKIEDFVIINKPRLLNDMGKRTKITYRQINYLKQRKEMVVNATGHPIVEAFHVPTYQEKVKSSPLEKNSMYIHINFDEVGYA